jgi:hypothetical protein
MPETRPPAPSRDSSHQETEREAGLETLAGASPPRERDQEQRAESARAERIPVGLARPKLEPTNIPPGHVYYWFNDEPGQLVEAIKGGWQFLGRHGGLSQDPGDALSRVVGVSPQGGPQTGYCMVLPQELYDEDQRLKAAAPGGMDEVDAAIRQSTIGAQENRYEVRSRSTEYKRGSA